jgi:hypothetical protein
MLMVQVVCRLLLEPNAEVVSLVLTSQVVSMSLVPMKELPQRPHQSLSLKSCR